MVLWEEVQRVALPRVVDLKVELAVEMVDVENAPKRTSRWELKLGKRSKKIDRWERQWYRQWGLESSCNICGEDHAAMTKEDGDMGETTYKYSCPIALRETWPPKESDWGGLNIWNSLDASKEKLAFLHGYNEKEINLALYKWENYGAGLLLIDVEVNTFKEDVIRICDDVRQSWTFKRTLVNTDIMDIDDDEL